MTRIRRQYLVLDEEVDMQITLPSELEAALIELARHNGVSPQELALKALRETFINVSSPVTPADE